MGNDLKIYTVYWNAKDFPDEYVVRAFTIADGEPVPDKDLFMRSKDIDVIHDYLIAMGLTLVARDTSDDSAIVCSYI